MSMPTLDDVAREVGVHPSTVSRALNPSRARLVNPETRQAVEEAARRLGYRPHMGARGLQSGRTATVGVIAADLGNPFVTPIIHGITASLEVAETMPVIAETQDEHDRFARILDHMLSRRVDAVVAVATRAGDRQILEDAARIAPVVIAARPLPGSHLPQVIHDDAAGATLAAEHLHELGHRTVVQLRGPLDVANFDRRAEAFSASCRRLGMTEIPLADTGARPISEEGRRLMETLLGGRATVPTAVFAHNDLMALGALAALKAAGLEVPADVSLIGYNDLPAMDLVAPPLTTIRYPSREIGLAAGELVVELLSGTRPPGVCLEPALVVRASTRRLD
ncbi:MAG TPA: LacI family DNA-binding transcriptional regulator [Acidimicrobiia bacterium]|nr:LacI family DNA-binding transcriptional regulator [Acidimicrobiia bacterium]